MTLEPKLKEKNWSPRVEEQLLGEWKHEYDFSFNEDSRKPVFAIDTPPPYPSGSWHVGAVAAYSMIDMIARLQRMRGFNVLYPFGWDRNGINIEQVVEKEFKKPMHSFPREEFIKLCRERIDKVSNEILVLAQRTGQSAEFTGKRSYMTDSPEYRAVSQAIFIELWNKGLIVEELRPNNYCPGCRTTIAEAEVVYRELPSQLSTLKFAVKEGGTLEIATTRPELLCACRAVLVHPEDDRYSKLVGKHALVPVYGNSVPIVAHKAVQKDFGTGALMVCSYGDFSDVGWFRELRLDPVNAIDMEGKMSSAAGKYAGLHVKKARAAILEDLKEARLLLGQKEVNHRTPTCERSRDPIEIIPLKEWYVKQVHALPALRKMADKMVFHQPQHKQALLDWIASVTIDWPISRRRYYHTEIPLWYCEKCGKPFVPSPGKYYQPWKEDPPKGSKCSCGSTLFRGEEKVFDTWMDSSCTPLYIAGYGRYPKLFKKAFPNGLRPQGKEIIRTWLYYTMLKAHLLGFEKPFEHVWIHGLGLDKHGKKMSKSVGNVVPPEPIMAKYGADAFRLWAAGEAQAGEDFCVDEARIDGALKFLTKFWNTCKFVSMFPQAGKPAKLEKLDEWLLAELERLKSECHAGFDDFNFFQPANRLREFVWNLFAPHYLELVKPRAYAGDASALYTLHHTLQTLLKLLAPICPFISDKAYKELYKGKVHGESLPALDSKLAKSPLAGKTAALVEFDSMVWKQKKEKGIPLNAPAAGVAVPPGLAEFAGDLRAAHKLE
ncbi:valine--tRNA ligase [Candidatus Micrarchaeota archaeon]|nr:valine--tRNA ligase [Candidatus Micrarchaeota archaeon]